MKYLLLTLFAASVAFATSQDSFDYTLGTSIAGADGGSGWAAPWDIDGEVNAVGGMTYTDSEGLELAAADNAMAFQMATLNTPMYPYVQRQFETNYSSGQVYVAYLMKQGADVSGVDYYYSFKGTNAFSTAAIIRQWKSVWVLGGSDTSIPKPVPGETNLVVMMADIDNNKLSMWINPDLKTPGAADAIQNVTYTEPLALFNFSQSNRTELGATNSYDEVRIGTSWGSVLPSDVPGNVQASEGTFSDKVQITWDALDGASSYSVWRSQTDDSDTAKSLASGIAATSYDDTTTVSQQIYYYWVKSDLSGVFSASASGYSSDPNLPDQPVNVQASTGATNPVINLTWDASAQATKYVILRSKTPDFAVAIDIAGEIAVNQYSDTNVVQGLAYFYWIKAGNDFGWSFPSDVVLGDTEYINSICYENFDYTSGIELEGQAGGFGFDGAWTLGGEGKVIAGDEGLTYPGLQTSGKSALALGLGVSGSSLGFDRDTLKDFSGADTVWYSFLFQPYVIGQGHAFLIPNGDWDSASGRHWSNFICLHQQATDVPLEVGRTYLLVVKSSNDGTFLWVDPSLESEPLAGAAKASNSSSLKNGNTLSLAISPYPIGGTNGFYYDEIRVGNTWDEVSPNYLVKNVQASDGDYTDKVAVTWTLRSDATSYVVYRSTVNDSSTASAISGDLTTDSYDDTSATPGEVYFYWIYGTFNDGQQVFSYSNAGYRSAAGAPAPPANIDASDSVPDQKFISITYDASAGATFYRIYRSFTEDFASAENVSGDIMQTSYVDSSVIAGVKYYYWVRAKNANGWSNFGDSDSGAIPAILVAYYAMNELDSTNMVDSSDNGFDGIYRDDPVLGVASADAALFETAVDFFEVSDATINSNTPIRDLTNNFTVAMWVKPDEFGTDEYRYVMGLDSEAGGWTVQTYNDEVLLDITGKGNAWTGAALSLTEWTHVAFTFDYNNQVRAFVDGIALDAITKIGAPADYVMAETYIANGGDDDLYSGSLDEIRVYNGVVTDASIAELAGVPEPATLGLILMTLVGLFIYRRR